jgi:anti-sigma factor (TIGR02949 family)
MLSCQDCEKYLVAFLDNALEVKERLDVEEHLHSCTVCMNHAEAEQTLRQFLRQHTATPPLPEALKRRIVHQAIQPEPAVSPWRWLLNVVHLRDFAIGMATAAAVLLLLFGPFFPSSEGDDMMQKFARETSMAYDTHTTQRMPLEMVSPDDKIVTQWLNTRMGYRLKMPCITDAATKLLGGRLCRLLDRKSATLAYQRNGVDLLLFAFKGAQFTLPKKYRVQAKDHAFYIQNVAGRPVAMWQQEGITYSIVGDMDQDDLLQVASTIHYR